jgi:hypothetical protein
MNLKTYHIENINLKGGKYNEKVDVKFQHCSDAHICHKWLAKLQEKMLVSIHKCRAFHI